METCRFAMVPTCQTLTMRTGFDDRETATVGWNRRWKH